MSMTLWYTETLPGVLVGLWVVRDVGVFSSAYWMVRSETLKKKGTINSEDSIAIMDPSKTPLKVEANFLSKVNTALQISLIAMGIAGEVPAVDIPSELMTSLW
jgi:phosphatidylglycerophosphate synthase